jgi:hypothetical protein
VSARKQRRELAAWTATTRALAHEQARALALQIASEKDTGAKAYDIGVVLNEGEIVWHRAPARFRTIADGVWYERGTIDWAITSHRLVGRLADAAIESISWSAIAGLQFDLAQEWVALDALNGWRGSCPALPSPRSRSLPSPPATESRP